jgi:hypothetical protein
MKFLSRSKFSLLVLRKWSIKYEFNTMNNEIKLKNEVIVFIAFIAILSNIVIIFLTIIVR